MTAAPVTQPVVDLRDVRVSFPVARNRKLPAAPPGSGWAEVVRGVTIALGPGERVALVGESGSGKTMLGLSMLGITPATARVAGGISVAGTDVLTADLRTMRRLRGGTIAMVFQDALSALNPVRTVGSQLIESARRHSALSRAQARQRAAEILASVGVAAAAERMRAYPHELSGGLRQRVMIALALINQPQVIVADEPTTALDATIQAQVLDLLRAMSTRTTLLLITHDLAVAAEVCDTVYVMYAGRLVEYGPTRQLLDRPRHPYTRGLIAAAPRFDTTRTPLTPIPGTPPRPGDAVTGCPFAPRCPLADNHCRETDPPAATATEVACWHPQEGALR
jgi:oligopeptide/dipeptide ABC transporter ATP-binding protein